MRKNPAKDNSVVNFIPCTVRQLPAKDLIAASRSAWGHNPGNRPHIEQLSQVVRGFAPTHMGIAIMTKKYWGTAGVKLTVSFMDAPPPDLRKRILSHMNAWSTTANVAFTATSGTGQVRIARAGGNDGGYWSYVGTDIEHIDKDAPTMNLEGFTMSTRDSEFYRVVRHETGHTLGCPHEHMRQELVNRIDRDKAIKYFFANDGWDETTVVQQVLTPISEVSIMHTQHADQTSIMCYQLPASITTDGQPITGGTDINKTDAAFMASSYPRPVAKPRKHPVKRAAKKAPSR